MYTAGQRTVGASMDGPADRTPHEPPRGTLAIVCIYAGLFILGWALLFFGVFVPRGSP
jgi:hypothetical protein